MVLGFKQQFVEPIMAETKNHTIRADLFNRWRAGRMIQMATGIRTKHYKCFKQAECISVQAIKFKWHGPTAEHPERWCNVLVATGRHTFKLLSYNTIEKLAVNDGFASSKEFFEWFDTDFTGKIIHWTNLKY